MEQLDLFPDSVSTYDLVTRRVRAIVGATASELVMLISTAGGGSGGIVKDSFLGSAAWPATKHLSLTGSFSAYFPDSGLYTEFQRHQAELHDTFRKVAMQLETNRASRRAPAPKHMKKLATSRLLQAVGAPQEVTKATPNYGPKRKGPFR
jgi:hypothetical protein